MVKFSTEKPIYAQIVDMMQMRIVTGAYLPQAKLPSVRDLAMELGVNPNTVQRALVMLEQQGFVSCDRTAGRFVTDDVELIKRAREALMEAKTKDFVLVMKHYGCCGEEIFKVIRRCMEKTGEV